MHGILKLERGAQHMAAIKYRSFIAITILCCLVLAIIPAQAAVIDGSELDDSYATYEGDLFAGMQDTASSQITALESQITKSISCSVHGIFLQALPDGVEQLEAYAAEQLALCGDKAIVILYVAAENKACICIGDQVDVPDRETAQDASAFCDNSADDTLAQMLHGLQVLLEHLGIQQEKIQIIGNLVKTSEAKQQIEDMFSGLTATYSGSIAMSLLRSSGGTAEDTLQMLTAQSNFDVDSGILIAYIADSGDAAISIGPESGIPELDLDAILSEFQPSSDDDFSGFQAGVAALTFAICGDVALDISDDSDVSDALDVPDSSDNLDASEDSGVSENSENPDSSDVPEDSDNLDNSDRYEEAGKIPAAVWIALIVVLGVGIVLAVALRRRKKKAN
jgi:hypothetical protein